MDSWPLALQWGLLSLVSGVFLGCTWWLALARARAAGAEPATWNDKARIVIGSLRFSDWAVIALLAVFAVPLAIRTTL